MKFRNQLVFFVLFICSLVLNGQVKCSTFQVKSEVAYSICAYNYKDEVKYLDQKFLDLINCALVSIQEINSNIVFSSYTGASIEDDFFSLLRRNTGHELRDSKIVSLYCGCDLAGNYLEMRKLVFNKSKHARREFGLIKDEVPSKILTVEGNLEIYFSLHKNSILFYIYLFQTRMEENDLAKFLLISNRCLQL